MIKNLKKGITRRDSMQRHYKDLDIREGVLFTDIKGLAKFIDNNAHEGLSLVILLEGMAPVGKTTGDTPLKEGMKDE